VRSVRADGSWPIDTNLATWVTTLSCNALASAGTLSELPGLHELRRWLLDQQFHELHPYTGAEPGGWSWTDLPGSLPDADHTPGTLLALHSISGLMSRGEDSELHPSFCYAIALGLQWLLRLQNRDGGWPTFCRGWGYLPFDRSGPDLTAHALRALAAWARIRGMPLPDLDPDLKVGWRWTGSPILRLVFQSREGLRYVARQRRPDGSWLPLG